MVETVEAFAAEHTVGIDEILYEWPASKFEALYAAYAKRKVADELSHKRDIEIAALWGNPNLDSEKDTQLRSKLMEEVDRRYSAAIAGLYGETQEEEAIDEDDPFFAAMKRGMNEKKLPENIEGGEN